VAESLFRKAAIDKVSSPEQLDLLMSVTSPVGWLALLTVGLMLTAVGVWSVVGSIPELVDGTGTLFRGERLYDIKATMAGSIITLDVRPGSIVEAGQTIAKLKREQVSIEANEAAGERKQAALGEIQAKREQIKSISDKLNANQATIEKNKAMVLRYSQQLDTLQRQAQLQEQLVNQGIKAPKELLNIQRDMDGVRGNIDSLRAEVTQLEASAISLRADRQLAEAGVVTAGAGVRSAEAGLRATTEVKSTESGRVVEVIKSAGDKVAEGDSLIRIERQDSEANQLCGGDVHALVYVPAALAGKIKKGQFGRVSPSDVKKEEYGFIFGTVEWVASYPASTADMTEKLKNDQLVKQFMSAGPVFETRVCLTKDPNNKVNPFKWSSSQGPPKGTDAGTTATVSMVVDEKKPYTYVIPAVRRAVGL
jgi:HlyD family secretion protein